MNASAVQPLLKHLSSVVIGAEKPAEMLLTALLADGHVLIEGAPGIGKTTLAHTPEAPIICQQHSGFPIGCSIHHGSL
jgi:MoxR-like ATPase